MNNIQVSSMSNAVPASSSPALLRASGLFKSYRLGHRSLQVLRDVSVSVARGECLALRGASGAGKSTLLHLLGGLDIPDAGEIHFNGQNIGAMPESRLAAIRNTKIGFVFQAYCLLPELDALENVCLPARMARMKAPEAIERAQDLLEKTGLKDRMEHRPQELSGGEQQRVAIARALINDPILILADEPTGNLDSHTGTEIIDLLCSLVSQRAMTLIMATHDSKVAARAQRTLELEDGQVNSRE